MSRIEFKPQKYEVYNQLYLLDVRQIKQPILRKICAKIIFKN